MGIAKSIRPLLGGAPGATTVGLSAFAARSRRRRGLPKDWLPQRFEEAVKTEELRGSLDNPRLYRFAMSVLLEGKTLDYETLKIVYAA